MARDYYVVLGIGRDATQEEIHAAYRRHAKDLHPDLSDRDSAPFIEVQEAYTVLGDPARRRDYDRSLPGQPRIAVHARPSEVWGEAESLGATPQDVEPLIPEPGIRLTGGFDTCRPSRDEVVERTWGAGVRATGPKSGNVEELHVEMPVGPDQARRGGRVRVLVPGRLTCPVCGGTGGIAFFECWHCGGRGAVSGEFPVEVSFPPGLRGDRTALVPLDHLGIQDVALVVHLRPTARD